MIGGLEERIFIIMGDGGGVRVRRNSYYCWILGEEEKSGGCGEIVRMVG